jgi:hypothetical protein
LLCSGGFRRSPILRRDWERSREPAAGSSAAATADHVFGCTLTSLTAPNTSACNSTSLASYCGFAFTGWSDNRSTFTPITYTYDAAPMAISKGRGTAGDVHNLTTLNVPIMAHTQFWFTNNGSSTSTRDGVSYGYDGSHLKNGVTTNNQAYITAMVQDLWDRGFDGILGNWTGGANTCTYPTFNSACTGARSIGTELTPKRLRRCWLTIRR